MGREVSVDGGSVVPVKLFFRDRCVATLTDVTTDGRWWHATYAPTPVGQGIDLRLRGIAPAAPAGSGDAGEPADRNAWVVLAADGRAYPAAPPTLRADRAIALQLGPAEGRKEGILFYRTGDAYGCFSNFSPHRVHLAGRTWPTSEHYFQAQKFAGSPREEAVRRAPTPAKAAHMGRDRRHPLRQDWETVKDAIMLDVVRAKFTQHAELADVLLSTGDAELVEHTANDRYWADGGDGSGENRLGRILMAVREELRRR